MGVLTPQLIRQNSSMQNLLHIGHQLSLLIVEAMLGQSRFLRVNLSQQHKVIMGFMHFVFEMIKKQYLLLIMETIQLQIKKPD